MGEREPQIEDDIDVDIDSDIGSSTDSDLGSGVESDIGTGIGASRTEQSAATEQTGGMLSGLRQRASSLVTTRSLLISLFMTVTGSLAFGLLPLLGFLWNLVGIFAGAFIYGASTDARRYFELALAGAMTGGGIALLGNVILTLFGAGVPLVMFGIFGGAIAGVLGHYFGRDLREGLTSDL